MVVAERGGLATMTVDAVVAQAGTGKGTFYRHFPDQDSFLVSLHQRFLATLRTAVEAASDGGTPGPARIRRVLLGYLDACLGQRALKAFITEARVVPAVQNAVDRAQRDFAGALAEDLKAMGAPHPAPRGRLIVAMAHEVALAEQAAGRRQAALRESLLILSDA